MRKLSGLVLEVVQTGGAGVQGGSAKAGDELELDLTGSREFLTKETAEELLAPLLAPGSKITKVGAGRGCGKGRRAPRRSMCLFPRSSRSHIPTIRSWLPPHPPLPRSASPPSHSAWRRPRWPHVASRALQAHWWTQT